MSGDDSLVKSKIKEGDPKSGYGEEKFLGSTYITLVEVDAPGDTGKALRIELDLSAVLSGVEKGRIKISAADSTLNYLISKILAGTDITITQNNPGGNENLEIATQGKSKVSAGDVHGYLGSKFTAGDFIKITSSTGSITIEVEDEGTFTGATDKIPTSSALKALLQALYITDATDCGSSGNALMYETKDMDVSRIMYVGDTNAIAATIIDTATSHYPLPASLAAAVAKFITEGNTDRGIFGNVNIITKESPAAGDSYYYAAFLQATLNENYLSGDDIYLDLMLKLGDSSSADWQTNLRAYPYYVRQGDAVGAALATVDKSIEWNSSADNYVWHTFKISGVTTNAFPTPIGVFIACMSEDGSYTGTPVESATIVAARIRHKKKTIDLRISDVDSSLKP